MQAMIVVFFLGGGEEITYNTIIHYATDSTY